MRLPQAEDAIVDLDKIARYPLSGSHSRGRDKARFFTVFGFSHEMPERLKDALLMHVRANDVVGLQKSEHGAKYTIQGPLLTPDGRAPVIRSVWIIDTGGQRPRFVTAFPGPR